MTMSTNRESKKKRSLCWDLFLTLKDVKDLYNKIRVQQKKKKYGDPDYE